MIIMKAFKNVCVILLLSFATCCVVFLPHFIHTKSEENLLNETYYLYYHSAANRPNLSSGQVARLYHNREINIGFGSMDTVGDNNSNLRKDVLALIEQLFSKDETVCNSIKETFTNGSASYSRNSSLIKVDNQPVALNFVNYGTKKDNAHFEILYEEKTKTVIGFSCGIIEKAFESIKDFDLYMEEMVKSISNYYENQLHLSRDEYYFVVDFPLLYGDEEMGYCASINLICGIIQQGDEFDKNIPEEIIFN